MCLCRLVLPTWVAKEVKLKNTLWICLLWLMWNVNALHCNLINILVPLLTGAKPVWVLIWIPDCCCTTDMKYCEPTAAVLCGSNVCGLMQTYIRQFLSVNVSQQSKWGGDCSSHIMSHDPHPSPFIFHFLVCWKLGSLLKAVSLLLSLTLIKCKHWY